MNERPREWWVVRIVVVGATGGGGGGRRIVVVEVVGGRDTEDAGGGGEGEATGGRGVGTLACVLGWRWAGPRQPHNSAALPSFSGDNDYQWALFARVFPFPFSALGS